MGVCFNGYDEKFLTFSEGATSVTAGYPVKVSANGKVVNAADGEAFCGITTSVRDGLVAVQMSGYVSTKYTGTTAPALGYAALAADGSGTFKPASTGGRTVLVVEVDSTAKTIGIIL